jgi:hypothetical protein
VILAAIKDRKRWGAPCERTMAQASALFELAERRSMDLPVKAK